MNGPLLRSFEQSIGASQKRIGGYADGDDQVTRAGMWPVRIFQERDAEGKQKFTNQTIAGTRDDAKAWLYEVEGIAATRHGLDPQQTAFWEVREVPVGFYGLHRS